ncbi:snRNA-activating protein complex subunit 2 [Heteronotia binoei]|uniref:snRNA-activating protein complex subunit 2 n=1 Tax=Heteronotia binoei TaxID=13085 RepID=UPI00292DC9F1|nr:snRNA-activating protein complex subunit 2 [Heteronotia binoei]
MKPPSRRRSAPARYALGPPVAHVWTDREKRRLLKALRAHGEGPLRPELLKKYLPSRDEAEILAFVQLLKERVAKEAVKAQYQSLKSQQQKGPTPAPIEVWTELAEKLTGNLENSETTAFSQVLTVASAEPLSLLHSVPPKPVNAKTQQCSSPAAHDEREDSQTAEEAPAEEQGFHVDFESIYKYLSMLSRGSKAPELSPGEAAVVLDLLLSLPEELVFLDIVKLRSHLHKCCMELNGYYAGESSRIESDSSQPNSSGRDLRKSLPLYQISNCHPQHKEDVSATGDSSADTLEAAVMDWKSLGVCPLNSFLLPLDILARKKMSLD